MIHVIKDKNTIPAGLKTDKCKKLLADVCKKPDEHKFNSYYYGHETVRESLRNVYGRKCAYCEADPLATSSFRIDHFRPKNKIKNADSHRGYFWLEDESTRASDQPDVQDGLPAQTWLSFDESPLSDEKRLLLNPEWDQVEKHFYYTYDGIMHWKTEKGKKSIEIYSLNRDNLIFARKKKSDSYLYDINGYLLQYSISDEKSYANKTLKQNMKSLFFKLLEECSQEKEFSAYGYFMFRDFKSFYVDRDCIHPVYKELLLSEYQKFWDNYLSPAKIS